MYGVSLNVVMCAFTASTKFEAAVRTLGEEGKSPIAIEVPLSAGLCPQSFAHGLQHHIGHS